jgi:hypothetical protein
LWGSLSGCSRLSAGSRTFQDTSQEPAKKAGCSLKGCLTLCISASTTLLKKKPQQLLKVVAKRCELLRDVSVLLCPALRQLAALNRALPTRLPQEYY